MAGVAQSLLKNLQYFPSAGTRKKTIDENGWL